MGLIEIDAMEFATMSTTIEEKVTKKINEEHKSVVAALQKKHEEEISKLKAELKAAAPVCATPVQASPANSQDLNGFDTQSMRSTETGSSSVKKRRLSYASGSVFEDVTMLNAEVMHSVNKVIDEGLEIMSSTFDPQLGWKGNHEDARKSLVFFLVSRFSNTDKGQLEARLKKKVANKSGFLKLKINAESLGKSGPVSKIIKGVSIKAEPISSNKSPQPDPQDAPEDAANAQKTPTKDKAATKSGSDRLSPRRTTEAPYEYNKQQWINLVTLFFLFLFLSCDFFSTEISVVDWRCAREVSFAATQQCYGSAFLWRVYYTEFR